MSPSVRIALILTSSSASRGGFCRYHWPGISHRGLGTAVVPLLYVGKVSYGVYVFHAFALLLDRVGLRDFHPLLRGVVYLGFTLVVAELSWRLFESRINALKERFPYEMPAGASDLSRAA